MVAAEFLEYISKMHVTTYVGVEDFADKFNFLFTVLVLLLCTAVVTVKQYIMKPISCYMANDPGGTNLLDYVENYCWVQGTVPINYQEALPETETEWAVFQEKKILYYQWVPFVLGLQCILFYIPRVIWQLVCYNRTGTDLQHLVISANQAVHSDSDTRDKMVLHLAKTLEQMLFQPCGNCCTTCSRSHWFVCAQSRGSIGSWLCLIYLVVKLHYLINACSQVYMMQHFLGLHRRNYTGLFGVEIVRNIAEGKDWESSLVFPRVAFCHVRLKMLGSLYNTVTAQCVIPVNMLNEKIFVFLWFWISVAALVTLVSLTAWLVRVLSWKSNFCFVEDYILPTTEMDIGRPDRKAVLMKQFVREFLRPDGVFLLRMIAMNTTRMIECAIVAELWQRFLHQQGHLGNTTVTSMDMERSPSSLDRIRQSVGKGDYSTNPMPLLAHEPSNSVI